MLMHNNFYPNVPTRVNSLLGLKIYSKGYNILILIEKYGKKEREDCFNRR
jgi:hypothetical protein